METSNISLNGLKTIVGWAQVRDGMVGIQQNGDSPQCIFISFIYLIVHLFIYLLIASLKECRSSTEIYSLSAGLHVISNVPMISFPSNLIFCQNIKYSEEFDVKDMEGAFIRRSVVLSNC